MATTTRSTGPPLKERVSPASLARSNTSTRGGGKGMAVQRLCVGGSYLLREGPK